MQKKSKSYGKPEQNWVFGSKLLHCFMVKGAQLRCGSLKNHGADELVDGMFSLGAEVMALPMEEKLRFEQGDDGMSFGYVPFPSFTASFVPALNRRRIADTRLQVQTPSMQPVNVIL